MKKIIFCLITILSFTLGKAQLLPNGDLILFGTNSWLLQTPDDGRTTLYIAPKINNEWDWNKQFEFKNNGEFYAPKISTYRFDLRYSDLILGTADGRSIGNKPEQRALVHFVNDELYINFNGDFEGGTIIDGDKTIINGNLGVGIADPQSKLHILGDQNPTILRLQSAKGFGGTRIEFYSDPVNSETEWRPGYIESEENGNYTGRLSFYTNGSNSSNKKGSVHALSLINGKVGVGTKIPDERLTVNGNIHAREVKVDLQVPADYVFQQYYTGTSSLNEEYRFPSLQETEQFIKENHHLPQVPSAQQIQKQGLKVGEMTNLLLQKIEELTLYSIDQDKALQEQEKKYEIIKNELQKQQEKITRLENLLLKN